jgi:hypothetical protein
MIALPKYALHMAHMAAQLSHKVTIYTNGNEVLAVEIMSKSGPHPGWTTDSRDIRSVSCLNGGGIRLWFGDGTAANEAFLAHSPSTRVKGPFEISLVCSLRHLGNTMLHVQPIRLV